MLFPNDLKYSKDHEWIRLDGNIGYVGITDFAQSELGDIVYVDIPSVGKTIHQFDLFGSVEAVKTVSDLFLPVTGKILEINPLLNTKPELVNSDPYGEGWMVKIELTDVSQLDTLMTAEQYKTSVGQ